MARRSRENPAIREFILRNVRHHEADITALACSTFGISRAAASGYMRRLVRDELVVTRGKTKAARYQLKAISSDLFRIRLAPDIEDAVWRFRVAAKLKNVKQNVLDICQYGFTEMLNNAIDHSRSRDTIIQFTQTYADIEMLIIDHGLGIFEKIQLDFNLPDARSALLELSKGKLTSDRTRHSGEGIFYTSRMFNRFYLASGMLYYIKEREDDGWLVEIEDRAKYRQGTGVSMTISTDAKWTTREVFNIFQTDDLMFRRTHVPISLGRYPGEQLVSRSQAKRILSRIESFSEVLLDFKNVQEIGQPFADEMFRVFADSHPQTRILAINTSPEISSMIDRIRSEAAVQPANGAPNVAEDGSG